MTTFAMPQPSPLVNALLVLTGARNTLVDVGPDTVQVRLGLGWRTEFARDSIVDARRVEIKTVSMGAHGWRGRWLVNTAYSGFVRLSLDPAATGRCYGIPHELTELTVSLEDPGGFLSALGRPDPPEDG